MVTYRKHVRNSLPLKGCPIVVNGLPISTASIGTMIQKPPMWSTQAAIMGIGPEITGKLILLAGGQGKNADFSDLYQPIAKYVKNTNSLW